MIFSAKEFALQVEFRSTADNYFLGFGTRLNSNFDNSVPNCVHDRFYGLGYFEYARPFAAPMKDFYSTVPHRADLWLVQEHVLPQLVR